MADAQATWRPAPLWDLVEESLDEAEFLWSRWETALLSPARDLASVSFWVEERLLGALEGLIVVGDAAMTRLLDPALDSDSLSRATAAAYAIAAGGHERGRESLVAAVRHAAADAARLAAFRRAIELSPAPPLMVELDRALRKAGPELAAMILDIRTFEQREPGPAILQTLSSAKDPRLHAAALRALRHAPPSSSHGAFEYDLASPDPTIRDTALETGLILGSPDAWRRCLELAAGPAAAAPARALLLAAMLGTERDQARVLAAAGDEARRDAALFALGFAGTRAAAEACLAPMAGEPPQARLAAEAFSAITGLDLEAERLAVEPPAPPEEPIPFEDEDLDADLVPAPEDLLPLPDAPGVARWWEAARSRFEKGQRYVGGRPVDLDVLQDALVHGRARRRHAIALELAIRTGGQYQVETRAFTGQQRRQMQRFDLLRGVGGALPRSPLSRSFSRA